MIDNEKFSSLLLSLFHLTKKPSDFELFLIEHRASQELKDKGKLDYNTLLGIVQESVPDCRIIALEAVDTTSTINIMNRIIALLKNGGK